MYNLLFVFADWYNYLEYTHPEDTYYDTTRPSAVMGDDEYCQLLNRSRGRRATGRQTEPKNFPCPNCSSGFTYEKGLVQHVKYECGQKPRFKCPYCEYLSKWMNNVYKHVRTMHKGKGVRYELNS